MLPREPDHGREASEVKPELSERLTLLAPAPMPSAREQWLARRSLSRRDNCALIGSGTWSASLWYNAGNGASPDLHIVGLRCLHARSGQPCSFKLIRDGGPAETLGEVTPDMLACVARFARTKEAWFVVHMPPRKAGHSRTSMQCEVVKR